MSMTKPSRLPSLSVFFPCFNEEANVQPLTQSLLAILPKISHQYEIIIINDGSHDQTSRIAHRLARQNHHIKVVDHKQNQGYGAAITSGIKNAAYEWVFYTDGDQQFDVSQLTQFISHTQDFDAIIGYRVNRADGQLRAANALLFKLFVDLLFRVHVKDIDCAFKLIRTNRIKSLPLKSTGAMISAELLYRLKKQGIKFKQLPVNHLPRQYGQPTGNNFKVIIKAGAEAAKLYASIKFRRK
jgi:glycosyltransferase involved in cell wall biosynthesis